MKPMLLSKIPNKSFLYNLLADPNYGIQEKFSGIRAIIRCNRIPSIITRGGFSISHLLPHLVRVFSDSRFNNISLDCELCVDGMTDNEVAGLLNPNKVNIEDTSDVKAYVFDVPVTNMTLLDRIKLLSDIQKRIQSPSVAFPEMVTGDYATKYEFFKRVMDKNGEGVVLKNLLSFYVPGGRPSGHWYKYKKSITYDCVITGFVYGTGRNSGLINSVEVSTYTNGTLAHVGNVSGFTDDEKMFITMNMDSLLNTVMEVEAQEVTKHGMLKHPRFVRFRPDKRPEECIW